MEDEVIRQFAFHHAGDVQELEKAARGRSTKRAEQAAHRIKGAARAVGAHGLVLACEEIEQACKSGRLPALDAAMARFREEQKLLEAYVADLR